MPLAIHARNYRGLVEVDWTVPPGLSVVVGANGAGKTTLLLLLDLLRQTALGDGGLAAAIQYQGGVRALKHLGAHADVAVTLGARLDDIVWQIEPVPEGVGLASFPAERLVVGDKVLLDHAAGSLNARWEGPGATSFNLNQMSALRRLTVAILTGEFPARPLVAALEGCRVYHDPFFARLRMGSESSPYDWLHRDGTNVFSVLQRWRLRSTDRARYEFVIGSLRECFGFFGDLDLELGGQIVEGYVVHRKHGGRFPVMYVAEGWLAALLHFTAVAGADRGHIVGIDSFENALHPRALTKAVELIRMYAEANGISVVLTTQSPQVIDCFESHPDKVFVLDSREAPGPRPLTELRTEEWLAHFRLGSEFADGDFGWEPQE